MLDFPTYIAYVAACVAIVIVPGPNVTVIIANSIRHGTSAGLMSVAGTQAGLVVILAVLAVGLSTIVDQMGHVFEWLRLLGAAYLIWLGVKLWRAEGTLGMEDEKALPRRNFFWHGFIVLLSNPKALLFFGAFIPQFIDPAGDASAQTLFLGATFMAVATVLDSGYALAAGRAGRLLSRSNVRYLEWVSGTFLIGGGFWLMLAKRT